MSRLFIERPILAWVIAIIIMLAGIGSIHLLPIEQYPDIARDGFLRHKEGAGVDGLRELCADEHPREKHRLRVRKASAQGDRPGAFVDHQLGELDGAREAIVAAVVELEAHLRASRHDSARGKRALQRKHVRSRLLDVDENRIGALDHRQWIGLVGGHQRADGEQ